MKKTRIIAIEGIDGSGKTLQVQLLKDAIEAAGFRVLYKSFPVYDSFFGSQVGRLLKGENGLRADAIDSRSMCLWFALDRFAAFADYRDGEYDVLLINRYTLSNAVYQGIRDIDAGAKDNWEWVKQLEHGELNLPEPDLYVLLDVNPTRAQQNVDQKGHRDYVGGNARDVYEAQDGILLRARARYLEIASRETNFEVIPCMEDGELLPPETIAGLVQAAVKKRGLLYKKSEETI